MLNNVGATPVSIGAVCVCEAVMARRSGRSPIFSFKRRATSSVTSLGTPRLSVVIKIAGPRSGSLKAKAFAQIL